MKNQEFYIFYSENEKDQIHFKLVKTYTNRFSIDEDDQSEVMGFYPHNARSDHQYLKYLQYLNPLQSYKSKGFQQLRNTVSVIDESLKTRKGKHDKFEIHFLFGIPKNYFTRLIYKFIPGTYGERFTITFLDGQREKINRQFDPNLFQNSLTIGDDIELLNDQPTNRNDQVGFTSSSLSIFQKSEDSYEKIECTRETFTKEAVHWNIFKEFVINVTLILLVVLRGHLISNWFHVKISEILNTDIELWSGSFSGFALCFLLSLQISVSAAILYIVSKFFMSIWFLIATFFIKSTNNPDQIKFTCVKFKVNILVRTLSVLVFLSLIIPFIYLLNQNLAPLLTNIKRIISLL